MTRLLLIFALCLCGSGFAVEKRGHSWQALEKHLGLPAFSGALWGIQVVSQDNGATLFETNAHKMLRPASNAKLYTAALALDKLGPDFQIKTSLLCAETPSDGVLAAPLVVYGRGDFSWSARFHGGSYSNILDPLIAEIERLGIKKLDRGLIADESYFRGPPFGSGWTWEDLQEYYGAEVSALTVQDNVIDLEFLPGAAAGDAAKVQALPETDFVRFVNATKTLKSGGNGSVKLFRPLAENVVYLTGGIALGQRKGTDAVAVHQPARWLLALLRQELGKRGILVEGKDEVRGWPEASNPLNGLKPLGEVLSPKLSEMLKFMLKPSQNLYAQLLLLQAAAQDPRHTTESARSTEEIGIKCLHDFLKKAGVPAGEVLLQEGSGLSRGAMVTPAATVSLLNYMRRQDSSEVYRSSLPAAGVDGTLKNRLKAKGLAGNIQAKTGTLSGVNTLSGYATNSAGEHLIFSIMLNNYTHPAGSPSGAEAVDTAVRIVCGFDKPH